MAILEVTTAFQQNMGCTTTRQVSFRNEAIRNRRIMNPQTESTPRATVIDYPWLQSPALSLMGTKRVDLIIYIMGTKTVPLFDAQPRVQHVNGG